MEPNYKGANGCIDAMAVAWLFAQDHIFFNDDEITWDGQHHGIAGAQINGASTDEIPQLMEDPNMYFQAIGDLLLTLEKDEELRVPREKIHPALYKAIREGDLTGLTLFNLQACGRAFFFVDEDNQSAKASVLEMAGCGQLLDHPSAMANVETVMVDSRLVRGIPGFYKLVARMVEDMRAYNGKGRTRFVLVFANARSFDADQYLNDFDGEVEGAVVEPIHIEMCDFGADVEEPAAEEEAEKAEETVEVVDELDLEIIEEEEGEEDEEETSDRDSMLALLNLMVLTAGLGGVSYPQDILDELERAADDETVDLEDLAMRINDFTPGDQAADLSNITFSEGRMAEGRRFKVAVPDGWTVLKDYEDSGIIETVRPFVLIEGELGDPNSVSMRDRIIYSAMGGDVESEELRAAYAHECIRRALIFQIYYDRSDDSGLSAMRPALVWSDEVEAVNTRCFVFQQAIRSEGANGLEFGIMPFASDNSDFLRCVFAYSEDTDIEAVRSLVLRLAASVEADKPYELESRTSVRRALSERVSIPDLIAALNNLFLGYSQFSQQIFTASQYKYVAELDGDDFDEKVCTLAGAQGIADFCNRAIPDFELALDAYDAQARLGASVSDLDSLLNALQQVDKGVFPTSDIFDSNDAAAVDKAGIFDAPESLKALRERIRYAKQHPGKPTKF